MIDPTPRPRPFSHQYPASSTAARSASEAGWRAMAEQLGTPSVGDFTILRSHVEASTGGGSVGNNWREDEMARVLGRASWWLNVQKSLVALQWIGGPSLPYTRTLTDIGAGTGASASALLIHATLQGFRIDEVQLVDPNPALLSVGEAAVTATAAQLIEGGALASMPTITSHRESAEEFAARPGVMANRADRTVISAWVADNVGDLDGLLGALTRMSRESIVLEAAQHADTVRRIDAQGDGVNLRFECELTPDGQVVEKGVIAFALGRSLTPSPEADKAFRM